eukprot:Sspe_Gene.45205::Locus_22340_Transcript_1_1_Confidence_1.000_Length_1562::g.45205::m.45205
MRGLLLLLAFVTGGQAAKCITDMDCGLNGDCVSGSCRCDAGWTDPPEGGNIGCSYLKFEDSNPDAFGYLNSTADTWGGNPVYNPDDGRWHVFTAMFSNGCSVNSWKTNSFIFHAHGPTATGPWTGSDVSVNIFAHNPQTLRLPDGTWLMYFIGGWHYPLSTRQNCTAGPVYPPESSDAGLGPTADGCGPAPNNSGCGIRYAVARSPYGPWDLHNMQYTNYNHSSLVDCAKTNPAPLLLRNGSIALAFNGGYCHHSVETIAVMIADSWDAPFTIFHAPIAMDSASEDPTLWETDRGFHILGHGLGKTHSIYACSKDLRTWRQSNQPAYSYTFTFSNGTSVTANRMERPIMLANTSGPWMLTNSVRVAERTWGLYRYLES